MEAKNITVNISLNGEIDFDKIAEALRKEIDRVGVKVELVKSTEDKYRLVTGREPKAGDFVKFSKEFAEDDTDITAGKYYVLVDADSGVIEFYDDVSDYRTKVPDDGEIYELVPVEEPKAEPLKIGDYVVATESNDYGITNSDMILGKIVEAHDLDRGDDIRVEIVAHNYAREVGLDYSVNSKYFRKATDEEVERATEKIEQAKAEAERKQVEAKWVKIGRKVNEFKEGDFVKYKKCYAEITRVGIYDISIQAPNGIMPVAFDAVTLITPVEARFDKVGFDR
jgi:hypothetical protein